MPSTPISVAQNRWHRLILTVWPSEDHRRLGGDAICAISGAGGPVTLDGRYYAPTLDGGIKVPIFWSTTPQSVSVSLLWDRDSSVPSGIDLRRAVGELARIDTGSTWESRLVLVSGRISSYAWGTGRERLTFTLAGNQLVDRGDFYRPGAELTAARFPDIDNTGKRDRASQCKGKLPPICYAPVGSMIQCPAPVVVDEVDAVAGVSDLSYRRHLIGYWPPSQTGGAEQFRMLNEGGSPQFLADADSTAFRSVPKSDVDGLGDQYWYVDGSFLVEFGAGMCDFVGGADHANTRGVSTTLKDGWQIKADTGGEDDYAVRIESAGLISYLGDSADNPVAYGGPTTPNTTGHAIPLPPDSADATLWLPTLFGGQRGICQVVDVLKDWLSMCDLGVPVAVGDLDALRSRLALVDLSYVRLTRGSPWSMVLNVLEYLPIRVSLYDGQVRFRWRGHVSSADVVASVDLGAECGLYRSEAVSWGEDGVMPVVELRHTWDYPSQAFRGTITIDGSPGSASVCGRASEAWYSWREISGIRRAQAVPRQQVAYDTLETLPGAELAALWVLYQVSEQPRVMRLEADASWRWLEPGMVIELVEAGAVLASRWWVEGVTFGEGVGELLLIEVID
jgi:hypothetical protein